VIVNDYWNKAVVVYFRGISDMIAGLWDDIRFPVSLVYEQSRHVILVHI